MIRTGWWSRVSGVVALSLLMLGDQPAGSQESNAVQEVQADVASSDAETNAPPLNTLLGSALPESIDPASPLGQLVRLIQAGVAKEVLIAYINSSPRFFELDADGIIYLSDLGAPPDVIEAILVHDRKLLDEGIGIQEKKTETQASVEETPEDVTIEDLDRTVSPYGSWVYVEGYGRCWRPTVVIYDTAWRPYCDNGRWIYTDHGWYWSSNYSWGWATFHYGRWFRHARYGWCWWPDTVWAPSWVCWRYNRSYCGWAPLPPHTAYRSGIGIVYRGSTVSAGFDFNLDANAFTFVALQHVGNPEPRRHRIAPAQAQQIYPGTEGTHFPMPVEGRNRPVNRGVPAEHVAAATGRPVEPVAIQRGSRSSAGRGRVETVDPANRTMIVRETRRGGGENTVSPSTQPSRSSTGRANVNNGDSAASGRAAGAQSASPNRRPSYAVPPSTYPQPSSTARQNDNRNGNMQRQRPSTVPNNPAPAASNRNRTDPPPAGNVAPQPAAPTVQPQAAPPPQVIRPARQRNPEPTAPAAPQQRPKKSSRSQV